ncbi:chorismate mutase [Ketogulonicigenium robustum]|uniref:chorismate mutase n=1 Tax=Ketogulonicigenium robustum TaxID=92947 RepID=A0A1W6P0Q8_9RHOB|nr:chorismate mutase [Ketogulonicigenium robustum]ARO15088.1 chorismate mutase [Ketogulonicigenium robustum]
MKDPVTLTNMRALRAEIDRLDAQIVADLAYRATLIDRAVVLKPTEGLPARIDARVEEVVRNVRAHARAKGLDDALVEDLWRRLIDWSIAREEVVLGKGDGA